MSYSPFFIKMIWVKTPKHLNWDILYLQAGEILILFHVFFTFGFLIILAKVISEWISENSPFNSLLFFW